MKKLSRLAAAAAVALACTVAALSQEQDAPKVEVGAQFTSLSHTRPEFFGTENLPGFGGRLSYNFSDRLALEAEVNFLPVQSFSSTTAGGRALQAQFGVKAGQRFRRFGLFGKARPGFVSFDAVSEFREGQQTLPGGQVVPTVFFDTLRKTHFSFDVGGVLEFYPSRRVLVRFDAGDTIVRYGERDEFSGAIVLSPGAGQQFLTRRPAETRHHFQFTAGVAFRFGDRSGADDDDSGGASAASGPSSDGGRAPRYEVGAQFTSLTFDLPPEVFLFAPEEAGTNTEVGFGGRFTYNLTDYLGLEAEGNFFPRKGFTGQHFGGYPAQAQFGAKAGKRFRRFGVFGKARPGFLTFGEVMQLVSTRQLTLVINPQTGATQTFTLGIFEPRRKTYFSMDVGGVLELYPSRRLVTRFDFGDTIVHYGRHDVQGFFLSRNIISVPARTKHNFQFSAGLGFRF